MMQFHTPPPPLPNMGVPPPTGFMPPPRYQPPFDGGAGGNQRRMHYHYQPYRPYPRPGPDNEFDGKRLRKSVMRKTVDYNSSLIKMLEGRVWQRDARDRRILQPDVCYYPELLPPPSYPDNPINAVTTRFVKTATNKMRCPIFCLAWTPEGRRLVTGASSGEFTLWNGLTFNFETILQAHDSPVRTMVWSHNDVWMVTGDHSGYVKYWQSNMNNVKMFQAHKEAIRGLSFSPTDQKFATCSDDGTIRIWDFLRCHEERILRGHGADVKCVHWHPQKGLLISGSKDNQQPVKLWDPKTGQSLATLHAHKSTVMDVKWNSNGNWLVTASRDHLLKLFDLRNLSTEVQTFRGHKKEASSVAWHPYHEGLFCSGGSDGAILFWHVGADKEVGGIDAAHDSIVWALAWHPLGHILCSGSNDHTSKFWTRNRPGDQMRDKYNLNTLPAGLAGFDDADIDEPATIPGMGPDDRVELPSKTDAQIPGLDFENVQDQQKPTKKVPYAKPIPKNFQAQWNETKKHNHEDGRGDDDSDDEDSSRSRPRGWDSSNKDQYPYLDSVVMVDGNEQSQIKVPLSDLQPTALIMYGKLVPVEPGSTLATAIAGGADELKRIIDSGEVEELREVISQRDDNYEEEENEVNTVSENSSNSVSSTQQQQQRHSRFNEGPGTKTGDENVWYRESNGGEDMSPNYHRQFDSRGSGVRGGGRGMHQFMGDRDMRMGPPMRPDGGPMDSRAGGGGGGPGFPGHRIGLPQMDSPGVRAAGGGSGDGQWQGPGAGGGSGDMDLRMEMPMTNVGPPPMPHHMGPHSRGGGMVGSNGPPPPPQQQQQQPRYDQDQDFRQMGGPPPPRGRGMRGTPPPFGRGLGRGVPPAPPPPPGGRVDVDHRIQGGGYEDFEPPPQGGPSVGRGGYQQNVPHGQSLLNPPRGGISSRGYGMSPERGMRGGPSRRGGGRGGGMDGQDDWGGGSQGGGGPGVPPGMPPHKRRWTENEEGGGPMMDGRGGSGRGSFRHGPNSDGGGSWDGSGPGDYQGGENIEQGVAGDKPYYSGAGAQQFQENFSKVGYPRGGGGFRGRGSGGMIRGGGRGMYPRGGRSSRGPPRGRGGPY
ncbi:pre-mRNA 3' end processing protein WDR33 [Hetaerina americana]|uniref:pre-mRNA 3' end processing protein WDR33 n=1 Tax=Hetaerina americana TaxID=62018 RepID=UPI003A7F1389